MRSRVQLRRLSTVAVLSLVLLAGCSDDETPSASGDDTAPTQTATTEEPTEDPTTAPTDEVTDEPTTEPTQAPTSPPRGMQAALLPAETMPAPGDVQWEDTSTRRGTGPDDVSVCQVADLEAIGATKGVHSTYEAGEVTATHVVAEFPDELSATSGYAVLEAWLRHCAQQARERGFELTEPPGGYTPVDAGDQAGWSVHFYGPVPGEQDAAYIEAQALVRQGDTLSWAVWTHVGQDYNYPEGETPPERAIALMADGLASS